MIDSLKGLLNAEEAFKDPSSVFESPDEIADSPVLTKSQKLTLLKAWESNEMPLCPGDADAGRNHESIRLSHIRLAIEKVEQ